MEILRVEGLDKEHPIEHVVGRLLEFCPTDPELVALLEQIPGFGERDGSFRTLLQHVSRVLP